MNIYFHCTTAAGKRGLNLETPGGGVIIFLFFRQSEAQSLQILMTDG
jgi:hypothetical protein